MRARLAQERLRSVERRSTRGANRRLVPSADTRHRYVMRAARCQARQARGEVTRCDNVRLFDTYGMI